MLVAPLIHIEAVQVLAVHAPSFQKLRSPTVHAHGSGGENQDDVPILILGQFDLVSDLVSHQGIKVLESVAADRLEILMPPTLPFVDFFGLATATVVDPFEIPSLREETLKP
jgi:hypothetical protein